MKEYSNDLIALLEDQAEIIEDLLVTVHSLHVLVKESLKMIYNEV